MPERERRFLQRRALLVRLLRDRRGLVVADVRRERGDQHQRARHAAGRCARDWPRCRARSARRSPRRRRASSRDALQEVVDDERLADVELEVAQRAAEVDRDVVAQHLRAQHRSSASDCVGLTLPGMIDEPGLVLRDAAISPSPARGPDASQRMSLAIFRRLTASVFSAPCAWTSASLAASASNLFGALDERQRPSAARAPAATRSPNSRMRVEAGADRGAADRELAQVRQRCLEVRDAVVELRRRSPRTPARA